jgi:hypothetical protein
VNSRDAAQPISGSMSCSMMYSRVCIDGLGLCSSPSTGCCDLLKKLEAAEEMNVDDEDAVAVDRKNGR